MEQFSTQPGNQVYYPLCAASGKILLESTELFTVFIQKILCHEWSNLNVL